MEHGSPHQPPSRLPPPASRLPPPTSRPSPRMATPTTSRPHTVAFVAAAAALALCLASLGVAVARSRPDRLFPQGASDWVATALASRVRGEAALLTACAAVTAAIAGGSAVRTWRGRCREWRRVIPVVVAMEMTTGADGTGRTKKADEEGEKPMKDEDRTQQSPVNDEDPLLS